MHAVSGAPWGERRVPACARGQGWKRGRSLLCMQGPGQRYNWAPYTGGLTWRRLQVPLATKQNLFYSLPWAIPPSGSSGRTRTVHGTPHPSPHHPGGPAPDIPPTNSPCRKQTQGRGGANRAGNAGAPGTPSASGRGWVPPTPATWEGPSARGLGPRVGRTTVARAHNKSKQHTNSPWVLFIFQ